MLSRAALLLLSIWTLILPLRHTLLDADWAIGSKHPFEGPSGERRSQIDRSLFRGRAAVRYLAVWNAPAYPDRPLTAPEKARGPWTTKDYLSRVLQETSNEMVDALLAATQADLINAFCRMLSISGCFLLFAVRRPRGAAASKKEKVA